MECAVYCNIETLSATKIIKLLMEYQLKCTCGKKKPGNQKHRGSPFLIQERRKDILLWKSNTHDVNGLSDGYATAAHNVGTWLFKKLKNILSSSDDITTRPLIARWSSDNVDFITLRSLLNRSHSYYLKRTVISDHLNAINIIINLRIVYI